MSELTHCARRALDFREAVSEIPVPSISQMPSGKFVPAFLPSIEDLKQWLMACAREKGEA